VVSLPNGAASAEKVFKAQLEWLERFDRVVIMFDMDDAGRAAAVAAAQVLAPGKAFIATLPLKDANEMLKAARERELVDAIWGAKAYRPDGIVDMAELWDEVSKPVVGGLDYPYHGMNELLHGARPGELVTITAGTGIGKSAFCAEIAYHLAFTHEVKVGYIALEENVTRTARRFLGIHLDRPVHLPGVVVDAAAMRRAFDQTLGTGRLVAYDHFGSLDPEVLLGRIRYMVKSLGCRFVFLDHLSIVVSGLEIDDERKAIDVAMTKLRSLVEETGAGIFVVSHLRRVSGSGAHEEGHEVSLSHLRGSQAIAQLSDAVIALERDQQAEDREERNTTTIRVLKNRLSGETGEAGDLSYDTTTGRLTSGPSFTEGTL
jgi:twinkle protein